MIHTQRVDTETIERLHKLASSARWRDLQVVHGAKLGHVGGEMSAIDILADRGQSRTGSRSGPLSGQARRLSCAGTAIQLTLYVALESALAGLI